MNQVLQDRVQDSITWWNSPHAFLYVRGPFVLGSEVL